MQPILEQVDLANTSSITAFRYEDDYFVTPWHFHPQHELTLIEESTGNKFIGDYVGPYVPGEVVLLKSRLPHCWKNDKRADGKAVSTVIQWNPGIFGSAPELQPVAKMLRVSSRGVLFDREAVKTIIPRILSLPDFAGAQLFARLLGTLVELSKIGFTPLSTAEFTTGPSTEQGRRMTIVQDFVSREYGRKIYLREVAALIHLSEQSFSRFFSKMMGRPFFVFLNEYRINVAARLLLDTDWSVSSIRLRCGYDSPPFFHRQFRKFKGMTPARFRRERGG